MLPPEFCLLDNVSASVKKSKEMRDALGLTHVAPREKMRRIQSLVDALVKQKAFSDFSLVVEPEALVTETSVLASPTMISRNQVIVCDEK